ncbi:M23 family metallopeptidase [Ammoniphilus sp. CFH 90114]|uniref:M23 family metallopeptidase n=1 Tax=Ammoniphilus sp. CFH 90114 TaxID=2493665 RepID=UPI00100DCE9D|nr:M23 family metallopeptidase [Ammoniphilus sp. CFH 90114]RXT14969.1 M23 family metallopeptidase [Ammoniphilus sp. CFH 90114]
MNKKIYYSICLALLLLIVVLSLEKFNAKEQLEQTRFEAVKEAQALDESEETLVKDPTQETVLVEGIKIDGKSYVPLQQVADKLNGEHEVDWLEGTAELRMGNTQYSWVKDAPIFEKDGTFLPNEDKTVFQEEQVWIPAQSLAHLGGSVELEGNQVKISRENLVEEVSLTMGSEATMSLADMSAEQVVEYLSFLQIPIDGAHISKKSSHLPGALRSYRNGIHEGIDWYAGTTGIEITENTPVKSMADGIVVRADHDYIEYTLEEREKDLLVSAKSTHTPTYILDKLRGRSIWVQHDKGVLVRYAHLSNIEPGLKIGQAVSAGDVIGYVGNSGTSYGVEGSLGGLHLHSDILVYGDLFWEYLSEEQVISVLEQLFQP